MKKVIAPARVLSQPRPAASGRERLLARARQLQKRRAVLGDVAEAVGQFLTESSPATGVKRVAAARDACACATGTNASRTRTITVVMRMCMSGTPCSGLHRHNIAASVAGSDFQDLAAVLGGQSARLFHLRLVVLLAAVDVEQQGDAGAGDQGVVERGLFARGCPGPFRAIAPAPRSALRTAGPGTRHPVRCPPDVADAADEERERTGDVFFQPLAA